MSRILIILWLTSINVHGSVTADGGLDFGVSRERDKESIGISGNYLIDSRGSASKSSLETKIQLGSDKGRSLVATAAHEYQYEQAFIRTEVNNMLNMYYPGLLWNSNIAHDLEFKKENQISDIKNTNSSKTPSSNWSISTGPSFIYNRSKWLSYRAELTASKSVVSGIENTEKNTAIGLGKRISPVIEAFFDANTICSSNSNISEDDCRNQFVISALANKKNTNMQFEIGTSNNKDNKTNIYLVKFNHKINTYSSVYFEIEKSIVSIYEQDILDQESTLDDLTSIRKSYSLYYMYEWGRKNLEFKTRRVITLGELSSTEIKNGAIFYGYRLGSRFCGACKVGLSYEYSEYESDKYQKISSLNINKSHSRRLSSSLGLRETKTSSELDEWSINFVLSYKGLFTKLGMM